MTKLKVLFYNRESEMRKVLSHYSMAFLLEKAVLENVHVAFSSKAVFSG